jgi:hypothetical protein
MKKIFASTAVAFVMAVPAWAGLLTSTKMDKYIDSVQLSKSVSTNVEGKDTAMNIVGAGLRSKTILFTSVNVYVAELFATEDDQFVRDENKALGSLMKSDTTAIRLNFVHTVEAEKVQSAFREALVTNAVKLSDPAVVKFLSAVANGGDAPNGSTLVVLGHKNGDGSESVIYENPNGKSVEIKGDKGFIENIFKIWLGIPVDKDLSRLKYQIIRGLK